MVVHRPQRSRTFSKRRGPQQAPSSNKFYFSDLKRLVKNPLPILPAIWRWFAAPTGQVDSRVRSNKSYKSFLDGRASLPFPHAISLGDQSRHQTPLFRSGGASVLAEQFFEGSAHFATWSQTFPTGTSSIVSEGSGSGESDGPREGSSDVSREGSSSGTFEESLNAPKGIFPSASQTDQKIQARLRFRNQFIRGIFKEREKIMRAQEGQAIAKRIAEFARRDARLLKAMHQPAEEEAKRQVEEAEMQREQERRLHDAAMAELVNQSIREEQEKQDLLRGRWEVLRQQEIEFQNRVERENAEFQQGNLDFRRMRWNHPYSSKYTQEHFMRVKVKRREEDEARLKATKEKLTRQAGLRLQELREELDEELRQEALEEALRQEALKQEALRQEALRQEALTQETLRQEELRQEALRQEALRQEALRQEALRQEALRQEALRRETLRQEALRQEALRREALRQEALRREALRREALREALKETAEANARTKQAINPLRQILEVYDKKWAIIGEREKGDTICFGWADMPFPLFDIPPIGASDQITLDNVRKFLFHPLRQGLQTFSKKSILRKELLRWHSDKFDSNVLCYIYPQEKAAVQDAAGVVARLLTQLMREMDNQ
ncbi:hypothetical protein HETIRDRAFT_329582 [Heterobasidion irregulare TC 32-1]|uniref:Uncharacterized protein n=1 Tax=Heterobasidion irregulare (strain TC 32-1) TaxID=747525 RepID=W4JRD3_HETIT|nr:uncharacterized protein HETIRDRAFT_329582 [Heterobasidion irregulare TC 32-1]ETW76024.1 hypothetical protein HETIRDRAFT_329582 [Heterobasidion irregulare TC 32-1]